MAGWFVARLTNILNIGFAFLLPSVSFQPNLVRRNKRPQTLARRRGFTLIEALAAFAIMALALGQLLRAIGAGAENQRRADFLSRASLDGSSHLAEIGASQPLAPGDSTGRYDDGLRWRLRVAQDRTAAGLGGRPLLIGYRLRLEVLPATGSGAGFTLVAEKLVAPQPTGPAP
ncbi:hypothetical protein CCR94_13570 [Rhodoblastus sphagnicola]|uniref:General secretion pathway protein GspI n=2 Tax=Rhodoblastus sphagnicola TaxID=333368 RepID=A0A2S6N601_9HYPH|nr:hypothetical protein CCR94_13570 [Rhodoblastus sphagnicola]